MLVLTRKPGTALVLSNGVTVTVTKVTGNKVSLGIDAPSDVRVVRDELLTLPPQPEGNETDGREPE